MAMKIEKQSSKFIKPSVPTPLTQTRCELGLVDELHDPSPVPIVLFYSTNANDIQNKIFELEKSLEKTLTRLYPLAGKLVRGSKSIDCNDQGVEFIYAKVNTKLEDVLVSKNVVDLIDEFIPSRVDESLLATQVTSFECGGVAIGVNASHQIVDAATLGTFVNEWASAMNRKENESILLDCPSFNSSLLFPRRGLHCIEEIFISKDDILTKYTKKKLSFSESVIANMRLKFKSNNTNQHFSKVQLVSAIISKGLVAMDRAIHNDPRESIILQLINLRGKMPSIPKDSCGNFLMVCATESATLETTEQILHLLTDSVKKAITDLAKPNDLQSEEMQTMVLNSYLCLFTIPETTNVIRITSWCKFPFYEVDFGFGKPIWISPGLSPIKDMLHLIDDAQGNGVEVYLMMENKDVPCFEQALDSDRKIFGFSIV